MENNKYNEMNLTDGAGISRSLFTQTAKMPIKKNNKVGFVAFENSNEKSMRRV